MSDFHIWEGIYPGFADAPGAHAVTGASQGGFESAEWLEKSIARAEVGRASLLSPTPTLKPASLSREYPLALLAALAHPQTRALGVLDFGGGIGNSFPAVRAALPAARALAFHCVENARLCAEGRTRWRDFPEIAFHQSLDQVPKPVDIAHAGSALQYIGDWAGLAQTLLAFRPRYLALSDVPAGDIPTFASIQNYYGRTMKHWFWNLDEFVGRIEELGCHLIYQVPYQGTYLGREGPYPMDGFPPSHRLGYSRNLIFAC